MSSLLRFLRKKRAFHILSILFSRLFKRGIRCLFSDLWNACLIPFSWRSEYIALKPVFAQIEPTTRCNLRCRMCIAMALNDSARHDLSYKDFVTIIDRLPSALVIKIQGNGEPFLHPDIFRMISYAQSRGIGVFTCTNGTLLDEKTMERILKSGLFELGVSIESTKKELYEDIRRGTKFDTFTANISRFITMRKKINPRMAVTLYVTLMNYNFPEIEDFIKFGVDYGFDGIYFQMIEATAEYKMFYTDQFNSSLIPDQSTEKQFIRSYAKIASGYGIPVRFLYGCSWPWTRLYINVDGIVLPCCVLTDVSRYGSGNILTDTLASIWNKPSYRELRKKLVSGTTPFSCHGCSFIR